MTSVATFDWWRAPPCMEIVQSWTCNFSFSLSNSTYLGPFTVVLDRMKYRPAASRHDMAPPNHLARRVFHCGYNIFIVKTLTQWPPNTHMARYKLLHGVLVRKQHSSTQRESNGDDVQSLVSAVVLVPACGTSVKEEICWDISKH